jgi:Domain of unknown function (DUF4386)
MATVIDTSERRAARIGGIAYVAIIVLAAFAYFVVLGDLVEPDDAAATAANLRDSETAFRIAVVALVAVIFADVVVAWALYVFLRRADRDLALLAAWFRLMYTAIAGASLLALLVAQRLAEGAADLSALDVSQRESQAALFVDAYYYGWTLGLTCFGVHLLLVGLVIVKADYVPRLLGILVVVAGVGYLIQNLASVVLANYDDYEGFFMLLLVVMSVPGEFSLAGWLLLRGTRIAPPPTEDLDREPIR